MKKVKGISLVMLTIFVLVTLISIPSCKKQEEKVIKIGAILPLTGNTSTYGIGCKKGIAIAIDEINQRIKTKQIKVEGLYEDNAGVVKNTLHAFNKLVYNGVKIIIGPVKSSSALSLIPFIEKEKILLFSPTASSPELSGKSSYFLRIWPSDALEARAMAEYAKKNLNLDGVAIIYVNNDYGIGLMTGFKEAFSAKGGNILGTFPYVEDSRDFRSLLYKVKYTVADAPGNGIYVIGYHKDLINIIEQLRAIAKKCRILASSNFETPEVLEVLKDGAEGVIYGTPVTTTDNEVYRHFANLAKEKYGIDHPDIFMVNSYDIMMLLWKMIEKNNYRIDRPLEIVEGIKKMGHYVGASGEMFFTATGDVIKPVVIKTVKNGKFEKLELISINRIQ